MPDPLLGVGGRAAPNTPEGIRQVARQLEGVFVRELMKPLEADSLNDGEELIGSNGDKQWRTLHLDALADKASTAPGGMGIAAMITDELMRKAGLTTPSVSAPATSPATPASTP